MQFKKFKGLRFQKEADTEFAMPNSRLLQLVILYFQSLKVAQLMCAHASFENEGECVLFYILVPQDNSFYTGSEKDYTGEICK